MFANPSLFVRAQYSILIISQSTHLNNPSFFMQAKKMKDLEYYNTHAELELISGWEIFDWSVQGRQSIIRPNLLWIM